MSVRAKIFLITFSLLALATGGGGLFIQYQLTGYLNDDVNSNLENHAKIAQKLFIDAGLNVTNADILADDLGEASGLRVTIISEDGTVYGDSDVLKLDLDAVENHSNRPEIMSAKNNESGLSQRFSNTLNTDMRYLAVRIPFNGENGFVRIASPLSEINRALAQVRYIVLLAVLVGFIFAIFVSYFSSNIILGYLKEFISDAEDSINDDSGNPRSNAGHGSEPYTVESAQQDLKKDLQILAKQRRQFSSVLEKMGQGVLLLNKSNEVLFYNRTIKDDFWPELEVGTKFFNNISYPALKKFLKKAWEKNELAIEINGPKSINSSYLISARRDKTKDEMLVVFNDISKLRQLEKMKEDFIGNVSHELRTPISVIRANAETLIHGKFIDDPNAIGFTEAISKLGIERRVYTSGESKSVLDPFKKESQTDVARLRGLQNDIHEHFIEHVKSRRGKKLNEEEPLFTGLFWTGKKAEKLGLIDGIGAMQDVLTEKFGDDVKIKQITQKKGLFSVAGSSSKLGAAISCELIEHLEHRHLWTRFGL